MGLQLKIYNPLFLKPMILKILSVQAKLLNLFATFRKGSSARKILSVQAKLLNLFVQASLKKMNCVILMMKIRLFLLQEISDLL